MKIRITMQNGLEAKVSEHEVDTIHVNLDPDNDSPRVGPGAGNGFVGEKALIQLEHSGDPSKLTGVRIVTDLSQEQTKLANPENPTV